MKNDTYRSLFREQSAKSLNKYKSETIEQRVNQISKDMLVAHHPRKPVYEITTNMGTHTVKRQPPLKSSDDLTRKIRTLQAELKRKLTQDRLLRNFFKTVNSSNLTHIDIYLQMSSLQQKLREQHQTMNQQAKQYTNRIEQLQTLLEEKQDTHMKNLLQLNVQLQQQQRLWKSQIQKITEDNNRIKQELDTARILIQQLNKKNQQLTLINRKVEQQLQTTLVLKQQYITQRDELMQQLEQYHNQRQDIIREVQEKHQDRLLFEREREQWKDNVEKLELRLREYENMDREAEQKQKQMRTQYEQDLRAERARLTAGYEQEKQSLLHRYQQQLQAKQAAQKQLSRECKQLQEEVEALTAINGRLRERNTALELSQVELKQQQQNFMKELSQLQESSRQIKADLKVAKYQKDESEGIAANCRQELIEKDRLIDRLQSKISEQVKQNQILNKRCEEFKKTAEHAQIHNRQIDTVTNENYKTLGRLIEINNKLALSLAEDPPSSSPSTDEDAELGKAASRLTELTQLLIRHYHTAQNNSQTLSRLRTTENKQTANLLQHCKHFVQNQYTQTLIDTYTALLRDQRSPSEQQQQQKESIYNDLVQNLLHIRTINSYENNNLDNHFKDSLESIQLPRTTVQTDKKHSKNTVQRQNSAKMIKRREEVEDCDFPLKYRCHQDQNKENLQTNNRTQPQSIKNQQKNYKNEIRQKFTQKNPNKKQSTNPTELRIKIQKKYFRL